MRQAEDVPMDDWPDPWKALGAVTKGCKGVESPTVKGMGITCETLIETSDAAAMAPGVTGNLCQYCKASCAKDGQECPAEAAAITHTHKGVGGAMYDMSVFRWNHACRSCKSHDSTTCGSFSGKHSCDYKGDFRL